MFKRFFQRKAVLHPAEEKTTPPEKGDVLIAAGADMTCRTFRELSAELMQLLEQSTLPGRVSQLYMHYWSADAEQDNPDDPAWQNQAIYFWRAEEPFPKKSLPPVFETFDKRFFVFINDAESVFLECATAIPWFGMPGLGEKYRCGRNGEGVSLKELASARLIEYVAPVELTPENTSILNNREQYYFLVDTRIVEFRDNAFYLDGKMIPLSIAYSIGGVHIVERVSY